MEIDQNQFEKLVRKRTDELVREQEQFHFLFEHMIQGIVFHGPTGEIEYANRAASEILGLSGDQLRGKTSLDPRWKSIREDGTEYPGDMHPAMMTLRTGKPVKNAVMGVFIPERNEYRWININSIPRKKDNELFQIMVTFEDITNIKKSSELLNNLTAQVPGVVYQYRLYPDGSSAFPYSSPGMYGIYEVTPEEVREDASPVFTRIHPDDYDYIVESINESASAQTLYQSEFRVILPEQGLRWRYCHANPELLDDGSTLWHGIIMDITERKQAEEALRVSESFKRAMIACSPVALFSVDTDGKVLSWNESAERVFGWSAGEIIGKQLPIVPKEKREEYTENLATVVEKGGFIGKEFIRQRKDGSLLPISLSVAPILNDTGTMIGIMSAAEEITQRKKTEKELERYRCRLEQLVDERTAALQASNKELEAFTYSVSHDLRAPLRAINGFSEYIEADYADKLDDEGKRHLRVIRDNSRKMDQLITDLLKLSRLSRTEMQFVLVNMTAVAKSMFHEIAAEEDKVNFDFICPDMPQTEADASAIKQVWTNLIENALKYSSRSETKKIEIGYRDDGEMHTYFVKDYGSGFDPRYKDKLFGVFQRLHKESEFEGTGVGLAIVKRIIDRHGGRLWAEGVPGKGAVFHFSLPKQQRRRNGEWK
jgi:PAS domain S-box-containing protein